MSADKPKKKARGRKVKINLVFDETKRREFLGGFRKRKVERQKQAQEEIKQKLKDEKKRIKQENKEAYKRLVVSHRPIPELEKLLEDEYEDEDVNVKIVELSAENLGANNRWIGQNKPISEEQVVQEEASHVSDEDVEDDNELPGMGLKLKKTTEANSEGENEKPSEDNVKSKKEIKKILKKQATKKIQKSKIFQLKNKLERQKNKKKSQQKKERNHKFKAKMGKKGGSKGKDGGGLGRRKQ